MLQKSRPFHYEANHSKNMPVALGRMRSDHLFAINRLDISIGPPLLCWNLRRMAVSISSATPCRGVVYVDIFVDNLSHPSRLSTFDSKASLEVDRHAYALDGKTNAPERVSARVLGVQSVRHIG